MPTLWTADSSPMECRACRADLDASDRYCPACRAPNMQASNRHPRFGPPERDPGPIVAPRVVASGARPCPRCHDGIQPHDIYCRSCGMDVSLLAPLPPTDRNAGVWTTPGPQGLDVYKPLRRPTIALQVLVALVALVGLALALLGFVMWRQLGGGLWPLLPASDSSSLDWAVLNTWATRLAVAQLALVATASVGTVLWTRRAYRNLAGLDVRAKRLPPVWATAGWFVPGANLIVPKAIFDYTWRASEPRATTEGEMRSAVPTINHLWWICTLVALPIMALSLVELFALDSQPPTLVGDVHAARATLMLLAVAELLVLFAAGLYIRTLGSIADRQSRRAARLGPPAAMVALADLRDGRRPGGTEADDAAEATDAAGAEEPDEDAWLTDPWPDAEPALAHLGVPDTRSGKY